MVMKLELTPRPVPKAPSEERWRQMSKDERERFIVSVNEALSDPLVTMSEGRPHKKAKSRALDMLGLHFRAMGRRITRSAIDTLLGAGGNWCKSQAGNGCCERTQVRTDHSSRTFFKESDHP